MGVVTIEHVGEHDGQEVTLRGWLYNCAKRASCSSRFFATAPGLLRAWSR